MLIASFSTLWFPAVNTFKDLSCVILLHRSPFCMNHPVIGLFSWPTSDQLSTMTRGSSQALQSTKKWRTVRLTEFEKAVSKQRALHGWWSSWMTRLKWLIEFRSICPTVLPKFVHESLQRWLWPGREVHDRNSASGSNKAMQFMQRSSQNGCQNLQLGILKRSHGLLTAGDKRKALREKGP